MYQKFIPEGAVGFMAPTNIVQNIYGEECPYVEIAGIKWAKKNLGAEHDYDYGMYFQWGDTVGYTIDQVGTGEGKKYFNILDYKYADGTGQDSAEHYTKYNNIDHKTVLDLEDDAAHVILGGNWRMPTNEEIIRLWYAVDFYQIENYKGSGKNGFLAVAKDDPDKSLFYPLSGNLNNGKTSRQEQRGYYLTSTVAFSTDAIKSAMAYNSTWGQWFTANLKINRWAGICIRPILDE